MKYFCPNKHELPFAVNGVSCSSIFCSKDSLTPVDYKVTGKSNNGAKQKPQLLEISEDATEDQLVALKALNDANNHNLAISSARLRARHKVVEFDNVERDDAEAESYVTKRLVQLTPSALAEVEYQLYHGDDRTRKEVALEVLDRTGHGKKDLANGSQSPIIMIQNVAPLAWMSQSAAGAANTSSAPLDLQRQATKVIDEVARQDDVGGKGDQLTRRLATLDGDSSTEQK